MSKLLVLLLTCILVFSLAACSFSIGDSVDDPGDVPADEPGDEPGEEPEDPADDPADEPGENPADDPAEPGTENGGFGSNIGGWAYFNFQPGQYFYYEVSSDRSGDGWVSITVEEGSDDTLDITCAGNWGLGEFSDTATLTKDMDGWDLSMTLSPEGSNAMSSLLDISSVAWENVYWELGTEVTSGDKSYTVSEEADYAGIIGMVMVHKYKHFITKEDQQRTYCVNLDVPLPIYVECPAANDTWRYQLTEIEGF